METNVFETESWFKSHVLAALRIAPWFEIKSTNNYIVLESFFSIPPPYF